MKLAHLASAGALALTATFGVAGAAQAQQVTSAPTAAVQSAMAPSVTTGISSCPLSYLCFWPQKSYIGGMGKVAGTNTDWRLLTTSTTNCSSGTWNNCIQSAYNNGSSCTALLYDAIGGTGSYHTLARGDGTPDMYAGSYLKVVSANRWTGPGC